MIIALSLFLLPLGAERIVTPYFELDVPEGLEKQGETLSAASGIEEDRAKGDGSFVLILQQKGLNRLEEDAFNNYCRVIIRVVDSGIEELTNEYFKEIIESCTPQELDELYEGIELGAGMSDVLSKKERGSATLDGYWAIHSGYERKSVTEEKGSVIVDVYATAVGRYYIYVTTSYRKQNEKESLPLLEKTLSSLVFVIEEGKSVVVLYENTLPGLKTYRYKWPEENPRWASSYKEDVISESLFYEGEGNYLYINMASYLEKVSAEDFASSLSYVREKMVSRIKEKYRGYGVKITHNTIFKSALYIDYEYYYLDVPVYGSIRIRYCQSSKSILFTSESLYKNDEIVQSVSVSLGFQEE